MTETQLKEKVLARLNKEPLFYARKTFGSALGRGWPDIVGSFYNGNYAVPFVIELKVGRNKVTPQQAAELVKWAETGAIAGVCYSVAEVEDLLDLRHE